MQKIFLFVSILFSALLSNSQTLQHAEVLGRPTDQSMTVQLFFSDSSEVCVQYGTSSGVYPNQTSWQTFADSVPAEIIVSGLTPNTKYYYRVCYRQPGASNFITRPEYTFHTQRSPGSSFSFTVQADPHLDAGSDTALYRLCLQNQLEDNPDFMIDLGDFLMTDKLKDSSNTVPFDTISYRCKLLRSFYETTCNSVPLFIALGNHEGESGWTLNGTANNIAVKGTNERKKYFPNPAPDNFYTGDTTNHPFVGQRQNYYSWQWGDALFIVLDPFWYTQQKPDSLHGWRWTLGKTQYDWLKQTLDSSTATFKMVFSHHLIGGDPQGRGGIERADFYEWGGANIDTTPGFAANRPGWYKPIKDLLTENRVNIFFHGHDHFFAEQEKECMIYQETPQPSLPNFNYPNQAAQYGYLQGLIVANAGHLRVTVSSTGLQVEYVRAFLPQDTNATRHNKDVSATYFIGNVNCYDSLTTGTPVLWNSNYADELVYPNPSAGETTIEFTVNKAEHISLNVYNEQGQLVRTLIAGSTVQKGKYQIRFDGNDSHGNPLSAGVYFYSINGERNGKLVMIK